MYTQTSTRQGVRALPVRCGEYMLSKLISRHGKRILFVTSLYFQVMRLGRLRTDALAKLNAVMQLSSCDRSLLFPVRVRSMVWGGTGLSEVLNQETWTPELSEARAREISEQVVAITPSWLRYGQQSGDMCDDVQQLLRSGGLLATAA